ncbi:MAG: preprotein translocase subunit YajC [Clostridia bacterium]|nr:preprotein translocase subunit YajC [Clostridia bacterium]MBP5173393.1 preprotein translocase subunit YajC [Clostridia bacterium]
MPTLNLLLTSGDSSGFAGFMTKYGGLIMIVVMVVLLWFIMIRPQRKQEKETQAMRSNLAIGDEIVTIGGIVGIIISISGEDTVTIVSSRDRTRLQILRSSVSKVQVPANPAPDNASKDKDKEKEKDKDQ